MGQGQGHGSKVGTSSQTGQTICVKPRFLIRPDWRIRTDFGVRNHILGLFTCFFLFRAELVPVGIQTISVITKIIYIHERTTTGVVSIKIYSHILSPIYLYKYLYMYIFNTNIRDHGNSAGEHLCNTPNYTLTV